MRKIDHSTLEVISGSRFNGSLYNEMATAETLQELQALYSYVTPYAYGVDQRVILINGIDLAFLTGDAIIWNGSRFVLKKPGLRSEIPSQYRSKTLYHSTVSDETDSVENYSTGNHVVRSWFPKLCSGAISDLNTCDIVVDYDLIGKTIDKLVITLDYDPESTNHTNDVLIKKVTGDGKIIICSLLGCLMTLGSEIDDINFSEAEDVDPISYYFTHSLTSDLNSFGYKNICEVVFNYLESYYDNQIIDTSGTVISTASRPFLFTRTMSEFKDANNKKIQVDKDLKSLYFIDILYYVMPWFVKFFSLVDYNDTTAILWEDFDTEYDQDEYEPGTGPRTRLTRASAYVNEPLGINNRLDTILSNKIDNNHGSYEIRLDINRNSNDKMTLYSELTSKGDLNLSEFQDRLDDTIVEDVTVDNLSTATPKVAVLNVAVKPDVDNYREFEFIDTSIDSNHSPVLSNIQMTYPLATQVWAYNDYRSALVYDYTPESGSVYNEWRDTKKNVITNRGSGNIDTLGDPGYEDSGYRHRLILAVNPSSSTLLNITTDFSFYRNEWKTGGLFSVQKSSYKFDATCRVYLHPFIYTALNANTKPVTHAVQFNAYKFKDYANTERILLIGTTVFLLPKAINIASTKYASGQSSDGNIKHEGNYSVSLNTVSNSTGSKSINLNSLSNEIQQVKLNDYVVYDLPMAKEADVLSLLADEKLNSPASDLAILNSFNEYKVNQSDVGDYIGMLVASNNRNVTLRIVGDDVADYERLTEFTSYSGSFTCRMCVTTDNTHCHVCNLSAAGEVSYIVNSTANITSSLKFDLDETVNLSIIRGYNYNNLQNITTDISGLSPQYKNNSSSNFSIVRNNGAISTGISMVGPDPVRRLQQRGAITLGDYKPTVTYNEQSYINSDLRPHDGTELYPYNYVHTSNSTGAAMYLFNIRVCYTSSFTNNELRLNLVRASDGAFSEESLPSKYKGNEIQVLKLITEHTRPWMSSMDMIRWGIIHANNYNVPTFNKFEVSAIIAGGYNFMNHNHLMGGAIGSQLRTAETDKMDSVKLITGKATMDGKIVFSKFLTVGISDNSHIDASHDYIQYVLQMINSNSYKNVPSGNLYKSLIFDASRLTYSFDDNYDDSNNLKVVRQKLLNSIYRHFSEIDTIFDEVMGDANLSDVSLYQSKAMLDAQNIKLMRNMLSTYGAVKNLFTKVTDTKLSCLKLVDSVHNGFATLFKRTVQSTREFRKPNDVSMVDKYNQFINLVNSSAYEAVGQLQSYRDLTERVRINEIPSPDYSDIFMEINDKRYQFGSSNLGNASHMMISPDIIAKYRNLPEMIQKYGSGLITIHDVDEYLQGINNDLHITMNSEDISGPTPSHMYFTNAIGVANEQRLELLNKASNNMIDSLDDWQCLTDSTATEMNDYITVVKQRTDAGGDTDLLTEPTLITKSLWVLTNMVPAIKSRIDETANPFDAVEVVDQKVYQLSGLISWDKFKVLPFKAQLALLERFVPESRYDQLYERLEDALHNDDAKFIINPATDLLTDWTLGYSLINITLDLSDYDYILNGCIDTTAMKLNNVISSTLDSCLSSGTAVTDKNNTVNNYVRERIIGITDDSTPTMDEQIRSLTSKTILLSNVNVEFSNILTPDVEAFNDNSDDDLIIVDDMLGSKENDDITILDKTIINDYCHTIKSAASDYQSYVTDCKDATVTCLTSYYNTIMEDTVNELQDEVVVNSEINDLTADTDNGSTSSDNSSVVATLSSSIDSMVDEINDSIDQVVNSNSATLEAYTDVTTAVKLNVKTYAASIKSVLTTSGLTSKISASMEQLTTLLSHSKDSVKSFIGSCFSRIAHEFKVVTNHSFVNDNSAAQYTGKTDLSPIYKALGMGISTASSAIGYTLAILNTVVNKAYRAMSNFVKSIVYDGQSVSYRLSGYETIDVPAFERELSFSQFESAYPFIYENVITPYLLYYNEGKFSLSYIYLGMFVFLTVDPATETVLIRLAPKLYENYVSDEDRNDTVLYSKIVDCYEQNIELLNLINSRIYSVMPNLFTAMKTLLHEKSLNYVDHTLADRELERYNIHIDFTSKEELMNQIANAPYAVRNATCDSVMAWSSVGFVASTTILLTGNVYVGLIGMGISALAYGVASLMNDTFSDQLDTGELIDYAFHDKTYGNAMVTNGDIYQIIKSYPISAAESMLNQSNLLAARNLIHDGSGRLTPQNRFIPIGFVKGEPKIGIHLRTDTEMSILRILKITAAAAATTAFVVAQFKITKSARLNRKLDKTNAKMWSLDNKDPKYNSKQTKLARKARKTSAKMETPSPTVQNIVNNVYSNGADGNNTTMLDKVLDSALMTNVINDYIPIKQTNNDAQLFASQAAAEVNIRDDIADLPDEITVDVQQDIDAQTSDLTNKLNQQTVEIVAAEAATTTIVTALSQGGIIDAAVEYIRKTFNVSKSIATDIINRLLLHSDNTL